MPKLRKPKSRLKKVATRVDEDVLEEMNEAMDEIGVESRAEFVRMAIVEKIRHVKRGAKKFVEKVKKTPFLASFIPLLLPPDILLPVSILLFTALVFHYTVELVRAESPEEQARAQRVLAGCLIAGVLMAIAEPLASWATGIDFTNPSGDIPIELVNAVKKLLDLLKYIGVVVIVGGIIYGAIQLTGKKDGLSIVG